MNTEFADLPLNAQGCPHRTLLVQHRRFTADWMPGRHRAPTAGCGRRIAGFSLVEMMVVIAIITVLMGAATVLNHPPVSRAAEPASRLARCIELARAQAVAGNRNVALRFDPPAEDGRERVLRFLWLRPGQAVGSGRLEFRRPEKFQDIQFGAAVQPAVMGEDVPGGHDLGENESLVMTPDGQVLLGTGSTGFPITSEEMLRYIHIGVQPTSGGKVRAAGSHDFAVVEIQCPSGTVRTIQP